MLRLLRFKAANLGRHANIDVSFDAGCTWLRGGNGRGKSTLLDGLFFALCGKSSVDGRTRQDLLKWGAAKGQVELEFEAGGIPCHVLRHLHDPGAKLEVGGPKPERYRKTKEATERMEELVGADAATLLLSAFMPQGGAFDLVFGSDTVRLREYARLARLGDLERLRDRLKQSLALIPPDPPMVDVLEKLAAVSAELTAAEAELAALTARLETGRPAYDLYMSLRRSGRRPRAAVDAEIATTRTQIEGLMARLAKLPPVVPPPKPPSDADKFKAVALDRAKSMATQLVAAEDRVEELRAKVVKFDEDIADLGCDPENRSSAEIRHHVAQIRHRLRPGCECPVCESTVRQVHSPAVMAHEMAAAEQSLLAARQKESKHASLCGGRAAAEGALRNAEIYQKEIEGKLDEIIQHVGGFDLDAHHARIKACEAAAASIAVERTRAELERQLAVAMERLEAFRNEKVLDEPGAMAPADAEDWENRSLLREELLGRVAALGERKAALDGAAAEAAKAARLSAVCHAQRDLLERARAELHVDALPRRVALATAPALAEAVNKQLSAFNAPYSIQIDDKLATLPVFEGRPVDAALLSGGQKAVLAVAFRLAVAEVYAGWVSFMIFDEPTPHMDAANRRQLAETLAAVRDGMRAAGAQMVVCSHEDEIRLAADRFIEI
jgi:DNA repair exonuclease SbcCD ATPase subunit